MRTLLRILIIGALCLGVVVTLGAEPIPDAPIRVVFVPQWLPQAQFAGYYVAYEKGFYQKQGLDVEILRGGPEKPPAEWLAKGEADFGTMFLSTGIQERSRGTKLVNIAQLVQTSSFLLIAKKSSGIVSPLDMEGKKVGLWSAEYRIQPMAFFKRYGLSVKAVPQAATVNLFLRGGVDVVSAMRYNEYHTILSAGVDPDELNVFRLLDHGINFPEDGIYCLESTFRKSPEMCCRFVQASVEGWLYAFEHPEEALNIVMKYVLEAQVATNRAHQRWMLGCMKEAIQPPAPSALMGSLLERSYVSVARELEANGLIDSIPPFKEFSVDCVAADAK